MTSKIENFSYAYAGQTELLHHVSFEVNAGSITALLAPSGGGKSTLLHALTGLLPVKASGSLTIDDGQQTSRHSLRDWTNSRHFFSLVPQTPMLLPWKTVYENIALAALHRSPPKSPSAIESMTLQERVHEVLRIVSLEDSQEKYPEALSLGMASRVSFARSLLLDPQCLLLDEPFASLDALTRATLQLWLKKFVAESGKQAVLVTHDIQEALTVSDQIIVLGGRPLEVRRCFDSSTADFEKSTRRCPRHRGEILVSVPASDCIAALTPCPKVSR